MKFRTLILLAGAFLGLWVGMPARGEEGKAVSPVKIYDTLNDHEPGRSRFQLYPREWEVVDVPDAPTIHQFADHAVPKVGWHEIIVQHPFSKESVLIRFKIPGQLKRVVASERTLQFWRVGGDRLELRFLPNGKVLSEKFYGFSALNGY